MPYRRKNSPFWWVSIRLPDGKRVRRSTETKDRKEAEALEHKWKLEVFRQEYWQEEPCRTFDELMLAYLKAERGKRSHRRDLDAARHLREHFSGCNLLTLRGVNIREYIDARREIVKGSTINRELSLLSSAINYARREWEWEIPNPVSGRKPKNGDGRVRWISRTEAAALLREARAVPHLADFIRLALHTGCRKQELLGLEWNRVNLNERLIVLEAEHTKAGKRRFVPLNQTARDALVSRMRFRAKFCPASGWVFARRNGNRIKDVKRSFKSACSRAKIEDFRIHDLRHTCAAWLVSASVPLTEVRDLLGHSTVKMTERYAHLAPDNVRAAVEKLDRSQSGHTDEEEHRGLLA